MVAISYALLLDGGPASPDLLAVLQQIQVEEHAHMADILRLRFAIGVREDGADWTLLDEEFVSRLSNVKITMNVGGGPSETLIDAYVMETRAKLSNEPEESLLDVVAMDPTLRMNLEEKVQAWPDMADSDIATAIFGDYGFTPDVEQTQPSRQEVDATTLQRGTDIQFLKHLAYRNGFECYVETNRSSGVTEGHFHPPRLDEAPQGVLTVNMGAATNVNSFTARYEMLRPTTAQAMGLDVGTQADQSAEIESLSQSELGTRAALEDGEQRRVLLTETGLSQAGELQTYAQSVVDRSAWAIVADGELNTYAYEGVLRAKRPVNVRGVGRQFSGTYYVDKVLHTFIGDEYTQRFTLRRNALGLRDQESFVEEKALT